MRIMLVHALMQPSSLFIKLQTDIWISPISIFNVFLLFFWPYIKCYELLLIGDGSFNFCVSSCLNAKAFPGSKISSLNVCTLWHPHSNLLTPGSDLCWNSWPVQWMSSKVIIFAGRGVTEGRREHGPSLPLATILAPVHWATCFGPLLFKWLYPSWRLHILTPRQLPEPGRAGVISWFP